MYCKPTVKAAQTAMMNTLFLREHNRLAGMLAAKNPTWDDDRLFETARNIIIEFPSYQAALDCYNSPEYQAASVFRKQASTGQIIIMDGLA